jgi:glyoxylase-like metal-dependent hydrolase (beta-lactamase superfamily II)
VALIELGSRTAVIPGGVNVGVLRAPEGVVLIDTGLNESNAKKALKSVREEVGEEVVAILTTHAHADHFGGNAAVVKRTGARVFAPAIDEAVLRYPLLQPTLFFGGADPLDGLRTGFLLADPSPVDQIIGPGRLEVAGLEIEVVGLAGHSPNQLGVLVDGVFYCADVVLPEAILAKYRIPYLYSLTDHLRSLGAALAVPCRTVVAGHGPVLGSRAEFASLVGVNSALAEDVMERVEEFAGSGTTAEAILARLLRHYQAAVADAPGFYLLQPTAFAFLAHLEREGKIRHEIGDGRSLWFRARS